MDTQSISKELLVGVEKVEVHRKDTVITISVYFQFLQRELAI